jgi:glutathione S-transferase
MEPILLYGIPAGSSMGLVAALEWLGQPYALCRVDMLGEMRDAAYARVNARHETPVLITDKGQPLTETMAITAWIEARDSERVLSFDPGTPEADRMHQLMAFVNTGFTSAFGPLWTVMEMQQPDPSYQAGLRRFGAAAVIERHDKLEAMVGDGPYLLGRRPTLADAVFVGVARWLELHDVADPARWPRLLRLRQRLQSNPAVQFALAVEDGERPAGSGACRGHVDLQQVIQRYGTAAV